MECIFPKIGTAPTNNGFGNSSCTNLSKHYSVILELMQVQNFWKVLLFPLAYWSTFVWCFSYLNDSVQFERSIRTVALSGNFCDYFPFFWGPEHCGAQRRGQLSRHKGSIKTKQNESNFCFSLKARSNC